MRRLARTVEALAELAEVVRRRRRSSCAEELQCTANGEGQKTTKQHTGERLRERKVEVVDCRQEIADGSRMPAGDPAAGGGHDRMAEH